MECTNITGEYTIIHVCVISLLADLKLDELPQTLKSQMPSGNSATAYDTKMMRRKHIAMHGLRGKLILENPSLNDPACNLTTWHRLSVETKASYLRRLYEATGIHPYQGWKNFWGN